MTYFRVVMPNEALKKSHCMPTNSALHGSRNRVQEFGAHTQSVPQLGSVLRPWHSIAFHFVQFSLLVELRAASVAKAGQTFVVPNVGKRRLYRANALAATTMTGHRRMATTGRWE